MMMRVMLMLIAAAVTVVRNIITVVTVRTTLTLYFRFLFPRHRARCEYSGIDISHGIIV